MDTNGNDQQLPEHRQRIVEAANAAYQTVCAERDEAERKLREMTLKYEGEKMKLEHMDGVINLMESSIKTQQIQRDEQFTKAAGLQATVDNLFSILWDNASDEAKSELYEQEPK